MASSGEAVQNTVTSDILHNKNCFSYLCQLNIPDYILERFPSPLKDQLGSVRGKTQADYNPKVAYADLYTNFFAYIEAHINTLYPPDLAKENKERMLTAEDALSNMEKLMVDEEVDPKYLPILKETIKFRQGEIASLKVQKAEIDKWDTFIISIYKNDNNILANTYEAIKHIPLAHNPMKKDIEKLITAHTKDTGTSVNVTAKSPAHAGSTMGRFDALVTDNFKPQHDTSLATIRHYKWNEDSTVTEQRIGTQGQRHGGKERVSPLYERYLECEGCRSAVAEKITNIYFNNLGRDRTSMEGKKERALSLQLEQLEKRHPNIAVITLPADEGIMSRTLYANTSPRHAYEEVKEEFLQIASQNPLAQRKVKDFYISQNIRERIFIGADGKYSLPAENAKLSKLLDESFTAMGIQPDTKLSDAQQQAVWFHFTKFALTDHIINSLNPQTINFSCKDAIDRGAASSIYYNLLRSFDSNKPMSRDEFEQGLHAAATMVKGRGMNHHIKLVWNTVDNYINTNYDNLKKDPERAWLIEWRDANCPHERVEDLLKQRVQQLTNDLIETKQNGVDPGQAKSIDQGLKILAAIKNQADMGVSGKRLLLDAATKTPDIALHPTRSNIAAYDKLADTLCIKNPVLNIIGGLMKALVGIAVIVLSLGVLKSQGKEIKDQGMATASAGFESIGRQRLQTEMKSQLKNLKEQEPDSKDKIDNPGSTPSTFKI